MEILNPLPLNFYDYTKGWDNTNPGWYQVVFTITSYIKHKEMVRWVYDNLDKPERHCRWIYSTSESAFKFRYEKHYIVFVLRWQ